MLSCPIEKVAVFFKDGTRIILPNDSYSEQIGKYKEKYGTPESFHYLPEYEWELAKILRRERFRRNYAAETGDIQEYIDNLKKDTIRENLKKVQTVKGSVYKTSSHKKEQER